MILSLFDIGYKPNRKPRASGDDPDSWDFSQAGML